MILENGYLKINEIHNGNCIELMKFIKDNTVDAIIADLPYGTTSCTWDIVIPFNLLWEQYSRILKNNGVVILTAIQPFTSQLILSNPTMFKYCWYWEKERLTNITQVKKRPGKIIEECVVFYNNQPKYYPQMIKYIGKPRSNKVKNGKLGKLTDNTTKKVKEYIDTGFRYPTQLLKIQRDILKSNLHPTQKPVDLGRYFIRTYTDAGDLILDNTCGSGSFLVSALLEKRNFIGIELDENYYNIAKKRLQDITENAN